MKNFYTNNFKFFFLFISTIFLVGFNAEAATKTWTGAVDSDWTNADNWSGGVPGVSDNAQLNGAGVDPIISTAVTINKVEIAGTLTIASSGTLTAEGNFLWGIRLFDAGTLINNGTIDLGPNASAGIWSIYTAGTFTNNSGAEIKVNNFNEAIFLDVSAVFNNSGTITIGDNIGGNTGIHVTDFSELNNLVGGTITINKVVNNGITMNTDSPDFTNDGTLTIGNNSPTTMNYCIHGEFSFAGTVTNGATGVMNFDNASIDALKCWNDMTFINNNEINIGANASIGERGIFTYGSFTNNSGGIINIDDCTDDGFYFLNGTGTNAGTINIGLTTAVGGNTFGVVGSSTFTNSGSISVGGNPTTLIGSSGTFNNNTNGTVEGSGEVDASGFVNNGGTLAPGNSPGLVHFDNGEDFTNSIIEIEIDGTGTPGTDFDQITVNGTATLGGTLNITNINGFSPSGGDAIVIVDAGAISGTFSGSSSLAGWSLTYDHPNAGEVTLHFGPLPVELTRFQAKEKDGNVQLDWATASEINNEGFEVEHSTNGRDWKMVDFVAGNGTTFEQKFYSFTHRQPVNGTNFYRLNQFDFDGKSEYSKTVSVNMQGDESNFSFFPNPISGSGRLVTNIQTEQSGHLNLYNYLGKQILTLPFGENQQQIGIDMPTLPSGIYVVEMVAGRTKTSKRLVIK